MIEFIPSAHAQAAGASPAGGFDGTFFIMLAGFAVFMYFMIIRPQRKQQQDQKAMMEALAVGDEIITSGGVLGRISKVKDKYLIVRIADNVELTLEKSWVHSVLPKGTIKEINNQ